MTDREVIDMISNATGVTHSDEQLKILNHRGGMCIIACAGSGKALKNGTRVLTPKGYRPIESMKVGDSIFDEKGKIQTVTGVYPQGKKQVHCVKFNNIILDETVFDMFNRNELEKAYPTIECCKEHLWSYYGPHGKLVTKTTAQLMKEGIYEDYKIPSNKSKIRFEGVKVLEGLEAKDPYILAMLMNAEKHDEGYRVNIAYVDESALSGVKMWFMLNKLVVTVGKENDSTDGNRYVYFSYACNPLIEEAKKISIDEVLYTNYVYRKQFLHGIHDTSKNKVYTFNELASLNKISETIGYALRYTKKEKHDRTWTRLEKAETRRRIISITKTEEQAEMTCISVTGKNSLYLTEHAISTHNTTVLTHLLAKRAMTGEIPNLNKLLCTTYSKAGSTEMEERLGILLKKLGMPAKVQVKTMHATYYQVLRHFGVNMNVCSSAQRTMFINQAIQGAGLRVRLEDEDVQLVDSLLSYQVNNLLDDEALCRSYVYTLEDVSQREYSLIRTLYNQKKQEAGVIDFDDMQMYMYMLLCHQKNPDVIRFCRDKWEYFFIDEFQDISKIQFEILRVMITDPNKLIVIGDDDQCLVEGTLVHTPKGMKRIEELEEGEEVGTATGKGGYAFRPIDKISKRMIDNTVYQIHTERGYSVTATGNHIGFARNSKEEQNTLAKEAGVYTTGFSPRAGGYNEIDIELSMLGADSINSTMTEGSVSNSHNSLLSLTVNGREQFMRVMERIPNKVDATMNVLKYPNETGYKVNLESANVDILENILTGTFNSLCADEESIVSINRVAQIASDKSNHTFTRFDELQVGMLIPVYDSETGKVVEDTITKIERKHYNGYVYDLSVPRTRNFMANGICVHNCIYQWRGADPSIILNICGYYDITKFVLSTNYRCGGEIVRHASVGIKNNANRSEKEMIPFNDGGRIKLYHCGSDNLYRMSKSAYDYIMGLLAQGVKPNEIAVLSRNNQHLAILNNMLLKSGYFTECAPEMQFTTMALYKDIRMMLSLMEDTYDHNLVKKILWKVCPYFGVKGATVVADVMNKTGCSVTKAIGYSLSNLADMGREIGWKDSLKMSARVEDNLRFRFNSISRESLYHLVTLYNILKDDSNRAEQLNGILGLYISSVEFMYKSMDKARTLVGVVAYIKDLIAELGFDNAVTHLNITERYESGKEAVLGHKVAMSTMHGAKGKEWRYVVLFANDNVTCPSFEGIAKMLEDKVELRDISGSIDENRRLSYVGMTRAKEELMIFTDKNNMSVYMLEAFGLLKADGYKDNTHIIKMANNGGLNDNLLEQALALFDDDSEYHIDIQPVKAEDLPDIF